VSNLTDKLDNAMKASLGVGTAASDEILNGTEEPADDIYADTRAVNDVRLIPVDKIVPNPDQPRKEFAPESLAELGLSLKRHGQLQPIRVREDPDKGCFVLVVGERRWRSAKMMEMTHLACIIVNRPMTGNESRLEALIENCVREDLKPVEQAHAFKALMDSEGWTQERLAEELNLSPQTIGRAITLLALPEPVRELVEQGDLPITTAAELRQIKGKDAREKQEAVAKKIAREKPGRTAAVKEIHKQAKGGAKPVVETPAEVTIRVPGGKVVLQGKALCKSRESQAEALRRALEQVEDE
jgi:ParB family transcriptional regulator, chromosome partitioning protein